MSPFQYNLPSGNGKSCIPIMIQPRYADMEANFEVVIPGLGSAATYFMFLDSSGDVNFHFWGKYIPHDLKRAEEAISRIIFEKDT